MIEIKTDQDTVHILAKYARKSPAEVHCMIDRIIREWYEGAAPVWRHKPNLIPNLRPVEDSKITSVGIQDDHARMYKTLINLLNLDEAALTRWLTMMFIQKFKIYQKATKRASGVRIGGDGW